MNNNEEYLDIDIEFEMFEVSVQEGFYNTVNSLDIALPTPTWNIKDLEMNFTNIEFDIETKTIEENPTNNVRIYKKDKGFGVQIDITEPTIIYGVYLYGYEIMTATTTTIRAQINGYDYIWNKPNATKYRSTVLNMSGETKWYYQNFSSPLPLSEGSYYLIVNGTQMLPQDAADYYWYMNDINPIYPELYTSSYDSGTGTWLEGIQGAPFLYALRQKVNTSIFPENINMTAQIDGNSYTISNGSSQGKGFLKKTNVNYSPNKNKINIEIKSDIDSPLKCNLSYNININNILVSPGKLKVKYSETNEWILTPEIKKYSNNHTIKFIYPNNWYGIQVLKDYTDITSELLVDNINNYILLHSEVIQNNSYWEIRARSPSIKFTLSAPITKFKTGQELEFSIGNPILPGNYTFKLYNPIGIEKNIIKKELPKDSNNFSYNVPLKATVGNYTAYVFWNNQTDAGAQVQIFQISQVTSKDNNWVFPLIIGLAIAGGVVIIGGSSYLTIKKSQSRKREKLKMILEKCTDIMSLRHIIVLHTKSGIDVYSQSFGGEELDPTLIAGFLQAIHNFGSEVIEHAKDSRTVKVEYQKSNIIMTEFVNLRLIIIMDKNPSKNFYYSIESLAYYIYKYYGKLLEKFQGSLKPFRSIEKLVEKTLNVPFIYPLKIKVNKNLKLSQSEKEMVKKASTFMKENNFDYFYSLYLLPDNVCSPKDYGTILNLIEKGVFQPIEDKSNQ
ncbi:MAG: hypothetical protein ACFE9I_04155 [Candidatus Hermodarchaeota archaeon]